jgi:hypothetical protein
MSSYIRQPADDEAWLPRVTAALKAVRSLYQSVSREHGNTARLAWQMRSLRQARAAWLAGDRGRARRLLAAALDPDGEPPPAGNSASAPASVNGLVGERGADGPAGQNAAPDCAESDAGQSAPG